MTHDKNNIINIKKGFIRYEAFVDFDTARVEYDEWLVSSIQNRYGCLRVYWKNKIIGLTWGKRSKKHGDYGFLNNIPACCKKTTKYPELLFSASKKGALRCCISDLRKDIKIYGKDEVVFADDSKTLGQRLNGALRAQKRLKKLTKMI